MQVGDGVAYRAASLPVTPCLVSVQARALPKEAGKLDFCVMSPLELSVFAANASFLKHSI